MINIQISLVMSGAPQAGVFALDWASLSMLVPVLGGLVLATIGGVVLLRRKRTTAVGTEEVQEMAAGRELAFEGDVRQEVRQARLGPPRAVPAGAAEGEQPFVHAHATDPGLARLFVELGVSEEQDLMEAGETCNDEESLRTALMRAASVGAAERRAGKGEEYEPPMVTAVAVEEPVEVETVAVDEVPMVEAAGTESASEMVVGETAAMELVDEIPEVAAEPVEMNEAEAAFEAAEEAMVEAAPAEVAVEAFAVEAVATDAVAAEAVEIDAVAVQAVSVEVEAASAEERQEEAMPVVSAEAVLAESINQVEFEVQAEQVSGPEVVELAADGQTTFFTFEDLNFQAVEDARPGEDGLGLSLDEAAAVLASGPVGNAVEEEKKEAQMPRMEEIFPALVNDEGPETEDSMATPGAMETAAAVPQSQKPIASTTKPAGRSSRLKRITLGVPVLVRGPKSNPALLREVTQTLAVLPQGAVVSMGAKIGLGDELNLVNLKTGNEVECRVVAMKLGGDGKNNVEVEFMQELTSFWPVSFPGDAPRGRGREAQMSTVQR